MRQEQRAAGGVQTGRAVAADAATRQGRTAERAAVTVEDIRRRAYEHWEAAGRPPGNGVEFWLRAEREMGQGTDYPIPARL